LGLLVPMPTCAILSSEQDISKMSVVILFFMLLNSKLYQFVNASVIQLVPLYNFTISEVVL
jgi:heptaprenylglyceryl phosphate synthase